MKNGMMVIAARFSNDPIDIFHGDFCDEMYWDASNLCNGEPGYPAEVKAFMKIQRSCRDRMPFWR